MAENFTPIGAEGQESFDHKAYLEHLAAATDHYRNVPTLAHNREHFAETGQTIPDYFNEGNADGRVIDYHDPRSLIECLRGLLADLRKRQADFEQLRNAEGRLEDRVAVDYILRHTPDVLYVEDLIDKGELHLDDEERAELTEVLDGFRGTVAHFGLQMPEGYELRTLAEAQEDADGGK